MQNNNNINFDNIKSVYFIGIGGISMSGLAEIMLSLGFEVSGSDVRESKITERLVKKGIAVNIGHSENNIKDPGLVVYTAAIKDDNPELVQTKQKEILTVERAVLLGQIMQSYLYSVAISGTHGKTTTTSMISIIMLEAGFDPTIHIGGELKRINGNTKIGSLKYFIAEACEYVESFLKLNPFIAVILNVDLDHLDYFKDINHIKDAFVKFASNVPKDGYIIASADNENTMNILEKLDRNIVTFGIKTPNVEWTASNIKFDNLGCASFEVLNKGISLGLIKLNVPGIHNVSNALASIAVCSLLKCPIKDIKKGMSNFTGADRRFEVKGEISGIKVIDDYAHHPSEIQATLAAAKTIEHSKIWCVFQPHTYTRTKLLLNEFSVSFNDADEVILADIYAAREKNPGDIHSKDLAEKLIQNGQTAKYFENFDLIADYLAENIKERDLVITMGAGDIYKVGEIILKNI